MAFPSTPERNKRIIDLAQRETSPAFAGEFTPITKGPVFAVVALSLIAVVAAFYIVFTKVASLFRPRP